MTGVQLLDFGVLQQLAQLLEDTGMSASTNPEDVNLPGAWVTVQSVRTLTVDHQLQLECVVYLIAADTDYARAYTQLADLYNKVVPAVLVPDDAVTPQGVVMPGTPVPLPALRVPVNLI